MERERHLRQLRELTRIRFLAIAREREVLFWVFVFPIFTSLILGFAFRSRGETPPRVAVLAAPGADLVVETLDVDGELEVRVEISADEAERALRSGAVAAVVEVESLSIRWDPHRPESEVARLRIEDRLQRAAGRVDPVRVRSVRTTRQGTRYLDWLIPGLIGMNLMGTCLWGVGFPVAIARAQGLLRLLLVTPMRKAHFLLGAILAVVAAVGVQVVVVLGLVAMLFDVPVRGSPTTLALVTGAGILCFAAFGVLVVARSRTIEGASGFMNVVLVPMGLLCGVFFSYEQLPEAVVPLVRLLPLSALNDAFREILLDGAGLGAVVPEMVLLATWGIAVFGLSLRWFRWT